jgi:hypothetical protein
MSAHANSGSFYYAVFVWAVLLYGAGVLFKIGTVFLYGALIPWFSDEPVQRTARVPLKGPRRALWWGLGIYLSLAAVLQIAPTAALASHGQLAMWPLTSAPGGAGSWALTMWTHLWRQRPITLNIAIFMVEGVLGLFLLTERNTTLGRIALGASAAFGLIAAIFMEGLGYFFSSRHTLLAGAPGAGILLAALSGALLLMGETDWTPKIAHTWARIWFIAFFLGALCQIVLPPAYAAAPLITAAPGILTAPHALASHPSFPARLTWAAVAGALAFAPWARGGLRILTIVGLAVLWWLFQGLGLMAAFALAPNTLPLWFIALWANWRAFSNIH